MTLVRFDEVFLEFGDQPLLESASFAMEPNERVCLIGRNGAGKTSLLRLITGAIQPDGGEVHYASNLRVSQLEQTMPDAEERTVRAVVRSGLAEAEELLQEYDRLTNSEHTAAVTREMEDIQQRIDAQNAWNIEQRVETVITELSLPADKKMSEPGDAGWPWAKRSLASRSCCYLTSPPTISISPPLTGWKTPFSGFAAACYSLHMTALFCNVWLPESWKLIAARSPAGLATTRTF
jgi:ABC-type dipeptide/oligopeptide/nickel transport system ATPase component